MFGVKAPQIMMFGLMIPAGYGVSADFLLELMNNADMKGERMPTTSDGKKFPYTKQGITEAAKHEASLKKRKAK